MEKGSAFVKSLFAWANPATRRSSGKSSFFRNCSSASAPSNARIAHLQASGHRTSPASSQIGHAYLYLLWRRRTSAYCSNAPVPSSETIGTSDDSGQDNWSSMYTHSISCLSASAESKRTRREYSAAHGWISRVSRRADRTAFARTERKANFRLRETEVGLGVEPREQINVWSAVSNERSIRRCPGRVPTGTEGCSSRRLIWAVVRGLRSCCVRSTSASRSACAAGSDAPLAPRSDRKAAAERCP